MIFSLIACFRFEILGCSSQSEADTGLVTTAEAPGYLGVTWSQPVLTSADSDHLHASYFLLNVTQQDGDSRLYNTTDTGVNVAKPMWGARYVYYTVEI